MVASPRTLRRIQQGIHQTRIVAALMAAFSVVTALAFHHAFGDQNQLLHFLKNIAIAGGFLLLFVTGAGGASIDGLRRPSTTYGSLR